MLLVASEVREAEQQEGDVEKTKQRGDYSPIQKLVKRIQYLVATILTISRTSQLTFFLDQQSGPVGDPPRTSRPAADLGRRCSGSLSAPPGACLALLHAIADTKRILRRLRQSCTGFRMAVCVSHGTPLSLGGRAGVADRGGLCLSWPRRSITNLHIKGTELGEQVTPLTSQQPTTVVEKEAIATSETGPVPRRIAIVGGGVSGLGATWALSHRPDRFDLRLFEAQAQAWGMRLLLIYRRVTGAQFPSTFPSPLVSRRWSSGAYWPPGSGSGSSRPSSSASWWSSASVRYSAFTLTAESRQAGAIRQPPLRHAGIV